MSDEKKRNIVDLYESETINGEYLNIWKSGDIITICIGNISLCYAANEFHDLANVLSAVSASLSSDLEEVEGAKEFLGRRDVHLQESKEKMN